MSEQDQIQNKERTIPLSKAFLLIIGVSFLSILATSLFFNGIFTSSKSGIDTSKLDAAAYLIEESYFGEISAEELTNGAIQGMAQATNDPHTQYLVDESKDSIDETITGSFEGIGAQIMERDGQIIVVAPISESPAEAAGLAANDIILSADDESLVGFDASEASQKIRGDRGTTVRLEVLRGSRQFSLDIVRDEIPLHTVKGELLDNQVGLIELSQFAGTTYNELTNEITNLRDQGATSFILDLRNNPGGLLDVAINISNLFLEEGQVVVKTEDSKGEITEITTPAAEQGQMKVTEPLIVLINEGSASASEILAAALSEDRDIQLLGKNSFGKGTVQTVLTLDEDSNIKVSTAKWLTPSGKWIHEEGIKPDHEVELTKEEIFLVDAAEDYKIGDNNGEVLNIELILNALGYLKGQPDSIYDEVTSQTVQAFQADQDLEQTGHVTDETSYLLNTKMLDYIKENDLQVEAALELLKN